VTTLASAVGINAPPRAHIRQTIRACSPAIVYPRRRRGVNFSAFGSMVTLSTCVAFHKTRLVHRSAGGAGYLGVGMTEKLEPDCSGVLSTRETSSA
jgi:hypothetical protein